MSERPTPETDGLVRSLNYEMLASTETCYSEMRTLCRRLERERDEARERADTMFAKHAEILDQYRRERDAERALADRLAGALESIWPFIEEDIPHGCNSTGYMNAIELCRANITAWKEARSE